MDRVNRVRDLVRLYKQRFGDLAAGDEILTQLFDMMLDEEALARQPDYNVVRALHSMFMASVREKVLSGEV